MCVQEPMLRRLHARLSAPLKLDPVRPEYHRAALRWAPPSPQVQGSAPFCTQARACTMHHSLDRTPRSSSSCRDAQDVMCLTPSRLFICCFRAAEAQAAAGAGRQRCGAHPIASR
jgi:hypothetical protein